MMRYSLIKDCWVCVVPRNIVTGLFVGVVLGDHCGQWPGMEKITVEGRTEEEVKLKLETEITRLHGLKNYLEKVLSR